MPRGPRSSRGYTLVELMLSVIAGCALLLGMIASQEASSWELADQADQNAADREVQQLLCSLEQGLLHAQGGTPIATLVEPLARGGGAAMHVDSTFGFPDRGALLLSPGTRSELRVSYTSVDTPHARFEGLRCESENTQPAGTAVQWAGSATLLGPLAGQEWRSTDSYSGPVAFQGDGTGFVFRDLVDTGGSGSTADRIRWGAMVEGRSNVDGWSCIEFEPVALIRERDRSSDLNGDGDLDDSFDLGHLQLRHWSSLDPAGGVRGRSLGRPMILQEVDRPGGDMNGDGLEDPIFLWDPSSAWLRVRLHLLDQDENGRDTTRRVETSIHLRNSARP